MSKFRLVLVLSIVLVGLAACGTTYNDAPTDETLNNNWVIGWWSYKAVRDDGTFFLGGIIFEEDGSYLLLTNYDNRYEGTYTVVGDQVNLEGEAVWEGYLDNDSLTGEFFIPATSEMGQWTATYNQ